MQDAPESLLIDDPKDRSSWDVPGSDGYELSPGILEDYGLNP